MSTTRKTPPTTLPDGLGVLVYGPDCGLLAGALALLMDVQAGRVAPGAARRYEAPARLTELRDVLAGAAREQQAARHRELAKVAQQQPPAAPVFLAPAQPGGSFITATFTVQQAADRLGVTGQRVRALCSSGTLEAVRGPRLVWEISAASTVAYADRQAKRRRRSRAHGRQHEGSTAAEPAAAA